MSIKGNLQLDEFLKYSKSWGGGLMLKQLALVVFLC